jgi:hypothetical protein
MGKIVGLAFTSALNPTLVAATTVMLLLPRPARLMLGYWFGALLTGVTLGLVIVFALEGSGFEQSSKKTVHPTIALTPAGLLLLVVLVLATGRDKPFAERRATRKQGKEPPRWQRWMQKGDARITFVIGVLLSFPGASYLVALDALGKLHYSTFATVLVVIGFCLVALVLIEIPLSRSGSPPNRPRSRSSAPRPRPGLTGGRSRSAGSR